MAQPTRETVEQGMNMLTIAQKMLKENDLCVLATCADNLPNSSLMQYIYDGNCMSVFMLTLKGSSKQINIAANPQVSILIDTRIDSKQSGLPIKALTVYGKAEFVQEPQRRQALVDQMVDRFSSLAELASDKRCLVIQMRIEKMLLLDGVNDKSTILL
jgi:nitroimidazol reductase NimA-like FMN-containing flavoprotein (pyridoxamine 5'-phosphate oxidase superfamily)